MRRLGVDFCRPLVAIAVLVVCVLRSLGAEPAPPADRLAKIDGSTITGTIAGIDAEGHIRLADAGATLELDQLTNIDRPAASQKAAPGKPACMVDLLGGGRLLATSATVGNQQCRIAWADGAPLELPMEKIAALRFRPEQNDARVAAALAKEARDVDRIFVEAGGVAEIVEGLVERVDGQEVAFEWQGKIRKVPLRNVQAIVLAVIGKPPVHDRGVQVTTQSGSSLFGRLTSLTDGKLTLEIGEKAPAQVDWNAVSNVVVRSSRLALLSQLDPVEVVEETIATLAMPWQRDKSVGGNVLSVGGKRFARGLGVHARCLLRYEIGGRFDEYVATIGIDEETNGHGDCLFVVIGDGRELLRQRVRGGEPPRDIRLDVHGVGQLTLLVEPGEDLDLADHADWADARLIRVKN